MSEEKIEYRCDKCQMYFEKSLKKPLEFRLNFEDYDIRNAFVLCDTCTPEITGRAEVLKPI